MWHEQLADAVKRIADKKAKDQADNAKGIKARAADYLARKEYNEDERKIEIRSNTKLFNAVKNTK